MVTCWVRNKRTKEEKECTEDVSQRAGEEREELRKRVSRRASHLSPNNWNNPKNRASMAAYHDLANGVL